MKHFMLILFIATGTWSGYQMSLNGASWLQATESWWLQSADHFTFVYALIGGGLALLGWLGFSAKIDGAMQKWSERLQQLTLFDTLVGLSGFAIGILLAQTIFATFFVAVKLPLFLSVGIQLIIVGAMTWTLWQKRTELKTALGFSMLFKAQASNAGKSDVNCKILDTSVIIDGRISDLCRTGFIEGTVIIPEFVLEELQHIADSADLLKRNRGRRGLDILNKMQKELSVPVTIYEGRFDDLQEVDSKLVKLAKRTGGIVVTNDFNLNKVCELQGVSVLNINDLANAIKPVVLPGEEMTVSVVKDGKESGQGVAYLDDGTMIVVDGGREYIGVSLNVIVTSVLQTSAGRMIFARLKLLEKAL